MSGDRSELMAQFITHIQPTLVEASHHHVPQHYHHKEHKEHKESDHKESHKHKDHKDAKVKDHQKGWSAHKTPSTHQEDVETRFKVSILLTSKFKQI